MGNDRDAIWIGLKLWAGASNSATDHIPNNHPVHLLGALNNVGAQPCMDS